jgi:hypothetical protein
MLSENTTNVEVTFFVKADYGVQTFQGIMLKPYYNPTQFVTNGRFSDGSREVKQDVNYAECHIRVAELSPSEMLLEPTYPAFHTGWVKKVTTKLEIQNIKKGKYVVNIDIVPPSGDFNSKNQLKFLTNYVPGGTTSLGIPWVSIYIEVL